MNSWNQFQAPAPQVGLETSNGLETRKSEKVFMKGLSYHISDMTRYSRCFLYSTCKLSVSDILTLNNNTAPREEP